MRTTAMTTWHKKSARRAATRRSTMRCALFWRPHVMHAVCPCAARRERAHQLTHSSTKHAMKVCTSCVAQPACGLLLCTLRQ